MSDTDQAMTAERIARIVAEIGSGDEAPARGISPKRVRAYVEASGGRLRLDEGGVRRAVDEIERLDLFGSGGIARVRRRYPALSASLGPGGTTSWHILVNHAVLKAYDLILPERRPVTGELAAGLAALPFADDLNAAIGFLSPAVKTEERALAKAAAPAIEEWRRELGAIVASAEKHDVSELKNRLRKHLRDHRIDAAAHPERTVGKVLAHALTTVAARIDQRLAKQRFAAVVGYADHVERLKASRLPRRVVFHVGPTNSGKTHDAMQALAKAREGAYLAPLRLLALEGYERLSEAGLRAGMVTGEEAIDAERATHLAMTIEMASLARTWDVAVIDEIQMLLDPDRGWAWTRALLGLRCRTLYLCGSPDALPLVRKAAKILGEEVEVVEHERKSPLTVEDRPAALGDIRAGDALVAFSRRDVLFYRQILLDRGLTVSTIYGALSPEVRRAEAGRFRSGEAEVLVATDAIGMGLNLGPLRRVVFSKLEKFDGRDDRWLMPSEIRQIAGRAGRYGHHEEGLVSVLGGGARRIRAALDGAADPRVDDGLFSVQPEASTLEDAARELGTGSLVAVLREFGRRTVYEGSHYKPTALEETLEAAALVDGCKLPIAEKFAFATCPVDRRNIEGTERLRQYAQARADGRSVSLRPRPGAMTPGFGYALEENEAEVKAMSAYLWLARRFPETFPDIATANARRVAANRLIEDELGNKVARRVRGAAGSRKAR